MTTFQTPHPISVSLEFGVGDLHLVAGEFGETVVEVRPTDPTKKEDTQAAEQTQVEYESGALLVKGTKNWRRWSSRGGRASVDIEIRLPEGSRVSVDVGLAAVHTTGRLGELDLKAGLGDVRVDESGPARIRTGLGEVIVGCIEGDADVKTGSGRIEIGSIGGSATVKNSNGDTRIGDVAGRARLQNAHGTIHVDRAGSHVTAKTACGDVRLGRLSEGTTEAKTAYGQIEIGVLDGVAAWLELSTSFGRVTNELEDAGRPSAGERTTEISAHTSMGDIDVHRVPARAETGARS